MITPEQQAKMLRLRHELIVARGIEPGVRVTDLLEDVNERSFGYVDRVLPEGLLVVIRDDGETKRWNPGWCRTIRIDSGFSREDLQFLKKIKVAA